MNILSLFDGISCGRVAFDRAGIKVDKYYSSELDRYAISVARYNYPDTIHLGDIEKWKDWDIDWKSLDAIIAGSPCTGFSIAGKRENFEDPQSKLFFVFIEILEYARKFNPYIKFFLENVEMKSEWEKTISDILKTEPLRINSALLSAQNRKRLYWTNIGPGHCDLFGIMRYSDIPQPEDKMILLKDIIENGETDRDKSLTITASYKATPQPYEYFDKKNKQMIFIDSPVVKTNGEYRERNCGKSTCLDANYWKGLDNHGARTGIKRIGVIGNGGQGSRIYDMDGKSVTLNAVGVGLGAKTGLYLDNKDVRKLSPIECERLQTLDDNYTQSGIDTQGNKVKISNTNRYKMIGNGWTVDVIAYIFSFWEQC